VTSTLDELQIRGLVKLGRRSIEILDQPGLEELATLTRTCDLARPSAAKRGAGWRWVRATRPARERLDLASSSRGHPIPRSQAAQGRRSPETLSRPPDLHPTLGPGFRGRVESCLRLRGGSQSARAQAGLPRGSGRRGSRQRRPRRGPRRPPTRRL
jgi:hypothetical protein